MANPSHNSRGSSITKIRRDFSGKQVGPYLFYSLLGIGAAGSVYKAIDNTQVDTPIYAIKSVRQRHTVRGRRQQLAEMLNHDTVISCPHVMMLHDYFEDDGHFFLAFPLYELDMFRAIWEKKLYWRNESLIKKVIIDILEGVLACHEKGIYHRDLKPENIMCDLDGTHIKIADFGLSTDHRICRDGGCGTSYYMSPECWGEKGSFYHADLVDIWALGVILFNMVTCRHPWGEARPTDKEYTAFLFDSDHLLHTTPISEPLSDLLCEMWHPNPLRRLPIPAIKRMILKMDTLYKPRHIHPTAPVSLKLKTLDVPIVDSQKTCVAPAEDEKKKEIEVELLCDVLDKALGFECGTKSFSP